MIAENKLTCHYHFTAEKQYVLKSKLSINFRVNACQSSIVKHLYSNLGAVQIWKLS